MHCLILVIPNAVEFVLTAHESLYVEIEEGKDQHCQD